jgi:hypothetical protein
MKTKYKLSEEVESVNKIICQLKSQGCVCLETIYGMTVEECQKSPKFRRLSVSSPNRYIVVPSICAGKILGVSLWRRPLV